MRNEHSSIKVFWENCQSKVIEEINKLIFIYESDFSCVEADRNNWIYYLIFYKWLYDEADLLREWKLCYVKLFFKWN